MAIDFTPAFQILFGTKSDEELRQIVLNNQQKIAAIPQNASGALLTQGEQFLAEMKFCTELLKSRQKARETWTEQLAGRREAAVLNLKTAVSPNGQLIAAILEDEDGKTEAEISAWCDELAAMEDAELADLLAALVNEGVLEMRDNRYFLRCVCTETLFPEHPADWALQMLEKNCHAVSYYTEIILRTLEFRGTALLSADFPSAVPASLERQVSFSREAFQDSLRTLDGNLAGNVLSDCAYHGVLKESVLHGERLYYFPMLGEEGKK